MKMSQEISELAKALSKAQSKIRHAVRSAENPFFKSKYADLGNIWDVCREPLTENGLSISQVTYESDKGLVLATLLLHASGQWISGELPVRPVKQDPQGIGSALTYMRRYGLQSIVFVCTDDDDGEGAMGERGATQTHHLPPIVRERESGSETELENYVITIGKKYKGQRLKDVSPKELESFANWLRGEAEKKNEPLKNGAAQFYDKATLYLGSLKNGGPQFAPMNDGVPF